MKTMLLAAAAALTLGSATAFAAPSNSQPDARSAAQTQLMLQQSNQSNQGASFRYFAPQDSGVNWHAPNHWQGYLGEQ